MNRKIKKPFLLGAIIVLLVISLVIAGLFWLDLNPGRSDKQKDAAKLSSTSQTTLTSSTQPSENQAMTSQSSQTATLETTTPTTTVTTKATTAATKAPKPTTTATTQPKPTTVATTTAPPKSYADLLWYAIGDSITNTGLYPDILVRNMGFRYYYNDGVPATKMATMADRVTRDKLETFDLVTVFAGTNDYGEDTLLGTENDGATVDTFYGHVQKVIDKIRTAKPEIEIVFLTPIVRGAYETQPVFPAANDAGFTLNDYRQAIKTVCARNNVKVIDLYATSGITIDNISTYTQDNLHPNWDGAALIAQAIQRGLER